MMLWCAQNIQTLLTWTWQSSDAYIEVFNLQVRHKIYTPPFFVLSFLFQCFGVEKTWVDIWIPTLCRRIFTYTVIIVCRFGDTTQDNATLLASGTAEMSTVCVSRQTSDSLFLSARKALSSCGNICLLLSLTQSPWINVLRWGMCATIDALDIDRTIQL